MCGYVKRCRSMLGAGVTACRGRTWEGIAAVRPSADTDGCKNRRSISDSLTVNVSSRGATGASGPFARYSPLGLLQTSRNNWDLGSGRTCKPRPPKCSRVSNVWIDGCQLDVNTSRSGSHFSFFFNFLHGCFFFKKKTRSDLSWLACYCI